MLERAAGGQLRHVLMALRGGVVVRIRISVAAVAHLHLDGDHRRLHAVDDVGEGSRTGRGLRGIGERASRLETVVLDDGASQDAQGNGAEQSLPDAAACEGRGHKGHCRSIGRGH